MNKIGIIGGSGYKPTGGWNKVDINNVEIYKQKMFNKQVYFIYRHGKEHSRQPSDVNYYGNIIALQSLGVEAIISITAVGSLREELKPGDFVLPSQFIDFTKSRRNTVFFEEVKHTPMANPFNSELSFLVKEIADKEGYTMHEDKTIVTIEGQRFSTKAESKMFQTMGADIINMTTCPEVIFANELEIPYVQIATVTDYDCWKDDVVTYEKIAEVMKNNNAKLNKLIQNLIYVI